MLAVDGAVGEIDSRSPSKVEQGKATSIILKEGPLQPGGTKTLVVRRVLCAHFAACRNIRGVQATRGKGVKANEVLAHCQIGRETPLVRLQVALHGHV